MSLVEREEKRVQSSWRSFFSFRARQRRRRQGGHLERAAAAAAGRKPVSSRENAGTLIPSI